MKKILIAAIAGTLGLTALAAPLTASARVHVGVGINLGYPGYYGHGGYYGGYRGYYGPRYYGGYYPAYYGGYYSPYYAPPPVVYTQPAPVIVQQAPVVQQGPITECTRYPSGQEVCH